MDLAFSAAATAASRFARRLAAISAASFAAAFCASEAFRADSAAALIAADDDEFLFTEPPTPPEAEAEAAISDIDLICDAEDALRRTSDFLLGRGGKSLLLLRDGSFLCGCDDVVGGSKTSRD